MARPELVDDDRYATHAARGRYQQELDELVAQWTRTLSAAELIAVLEESGVPAGKIYRAPDMLDDPHFIAREAIIRVPHPEFGNLAMQNVFPKLSATPGEVRWPGPALGQHNEEIFSGLLGISEDRMKELQDQGII